jgi:hypothetical protein
VEKDISILKEKIFLVLGVMGSIVMMGAYLGAKYENRFSVKTLKLIIGFVLIVVATVIFHRPFQFLNCSSSNHILVAPFSFILISSAFILHV